MACDGVPGRLPPRPLPAGIVMDSALIQEEFGDFILKEEAQSVWITVNNISVYVRRTDEGVAVDLYPNRMEMEDSLCGTWALFGEAQERIDEYENELRAGDDGRREIADWPGLRPEPNGNEEGTKRGD